VNLIGEHTDYNEGFVFPAALDLFCDVRAEEAADSQLTVRSCNLGEERSWTLAGLSNAKPRGDWSDYVAGVAVELIRLGVKPVAARLEIDSTVPIGSGLSSSASLEVSVGFALASMAGADVPRRELALACQRAENNFVGMKCGIMDQFVSALGEAGHAILIDCRSLQHRSEPVPPGLQLLIVNKLPDTLRRRARHIVTENARVLDFVDACRQGDPARMGLLMAQSHDSLRVDYEVSCAELDFLVATAVNLEGVAGARMTGGGFGGCTVNLVRAGAAEGFRQAMASAYESRFGIRPEIYACQTADGVRELN
jgi:galactokinase